MKRGIFGGSFNPPHKKHENIAYSLIEKNFEIFKKACDESQYVSFDCEMTGLNLNTKTDGTKYDTQEFRYYKQKEVVSKLDLIQIGFTFYKEETKQMQKNKDNENRNDEKNEIIEKKYYLERTFIFSLNILKQLPQNQFRVQSHQLP